MTDWAGFDLVLEDWTSRVSATAVDLGQSDRLSGTPAAIGRGAVSIRGGENPDRVDDPTGAQTQAETFIAGRPSGSNGDRSSQRAQTPGGGEDLDRVDNTLDRADNTLDRADNTVEALFRTEYVRLVRALTVACGNADDAADAVQDAFVQAERHWRKVSTYEQPGAWLRRVAVNRLANRHRGDRRRQAYIDRTVVHPVEHVVPDIDLQAAVDSLPPGQRMAIGLHYLADLPVDEVAAAMGVSVGTVKSQLHDARKSLAQRDEVRREM